MLIYVPIIFIYNIFSFFFSLFPQFFFLFDYLESCRPCNVSKKDVLICEAMIDDVKCIVVQADELSRNNYDVNADEEIASENNSPR